jgi:hypothetical protein
VEPKGSGTDNLTSEEEEKMNDPYWPTMIEKMKDKNYDPLTDPEATAIIEGMVSPEIRELPNAIDRLMVAFTDATTGAEAVEDLDAAAATFPPEELWSSAPSSDWGKSGFKLGEFVPRKMADGTPGIGFPVTGDKNENGEELTDEKIGEMMDVLFQALREKYPDIPFEE